MIDRGGIADARESGIDGCVSFGPLSPIARRGTENYRPYQAFIDVVDEAGRLAAHVQSDEHGHFRIALPPGTYTLRPQAFEPRPRAAQQTVLVNTGRYTPVQINYDSGIR